MVSQLLRQLLLTYLAVRDYELNELLTGFFDIRGGGESASAWSIILTYSL